MADLYNRRESWLDYLPGNVQQSINTSPLLNALGSALNRRPTNIEGASKRIFAQPGDSEMDDRAWLLQQAQPQRRLNPLAAEMLDKGGLLANFLGPGARLPTGLRQTARQSISRLVDSDLDEIGKSWADAYARALTAAPNQGVREGIHKYLVDPRTEFGLRIEDRVLSPGATPRPSRNFDGRREFWEPGSYLDGTSVYGIQNMSDPSEIARALRLLRDGGFPGDRITLLGARSRSIGDDPGEWVFRNPIVAQQWRIGRPLGPTW